MSIEQDKFITELQANFDFNVFIMMRYRESPHFTEIEQSIKNTLMLYGLKARFAKDRSLSDDLWTNIEIYMNYSKYGIAVFEEIYDREFNPNISLELGYMYALSRRCLLLKDNRMPRLPTDTCGKIYKDFDICKISNSINIKIKEWCENDLGLEIIKLKKEIKPFEINEKLIYDLNNEKLNELSWTFFDSSGFDFYSNKITYSIEENIFTFYLKSNSEESLGINKSIRSLHGKFEFEYKVFTNDRNFSNIYFCVIPMKENGPNRTGYIEIGSSYHYDKKNAFSPYRKRFFIPSEHFSDDNWHKGEIIFDFRNTKEAFYCILAPRINEGCENVNKGELYVKNIKVFSFE